jgi:phosphoadenosine phosphosulfate reductase
VVPPVPIPNTEVKRCCADDSMTKGYAKVGRCQIINPTPHRVGFFLVKTNPHLTDREYSLRHLMTNQQIEALNDSLKEKNALQIVEWAINRGRSVVTTNFRPYEAVILHLVTCVAPGAPVLWVDHGANLPETYVFAEKTRAHLSLNLKSYLPQMTSAHWLALNGGQIPMPDEVERVESFSRIMKLEPFERGMRQLAPEIWITALRKEQNAQRAASLKTAMWDAKFNCLKINPILDWSQDELEAYVAEHHLPNERVYYDPAKGDEKHECGLHAKLVTEAK